MEKARGKDLAGQSGQSIVRGSVQPSHREVLRRQVRIASAGASHNNPGRSERTRIYIQHLEKILRRSLEVDVSLADMAYILDMEKTYCSKVFRQITGRSLCGWKRRIRIDTAKDMLRNADRSITEICHAVGYRDVTTFERNFLKEVGLCPRSFRKLHVPLTERVSIQEALTA